MIKFILMHKYHSINEEYIDVVMGIYTKSLQLLVQQSGTTASNNPSASSLVSYQELSKSRLKTYYFSLEKVNPPCAMKFYSSLYARPGWLLGLV